MTKTNLFDLVQKASPRDTLQQAVSSLREPYDMARFYSGYVEYLQMTKPIVADDVNSSLGIAGSMGLYPLKSEEAPKYAREQILRKAEEYDEEIAQAWEQAIEEEDLS